MKKTAAKGAEEVLEIRLADVRMMDLADVKGSADNPKEWNAQEFGLVKASLHRFGLVETLLWNERTKRLVDGHLRLAALRRDGVKRAQFSVVDWTAQQEMAFRYVLEKRNARGRIVLKKAKRQLAETQKALPDIFEQFGLGEMTAQILHDESAPSRKKPKKKGQVEAWEALADVKVPPGVRAIVLEKCAAVAKLNGWPLEKGGLGRAMERVFSDLEPIKFGPATEEKGA